MPGAAMAERVGAATRAASEADCDRALERSETINAEALFSGANICANFQRIDDSVFLMLAGQARGSADMAEAVRQGGDPPFGAVDLWGFLYGYAGGAGPSELYRDLDRTERLFARYRSWNPTRAPDYDPGWPSTPPVDLERYRSIVQESVEGRIQQLSQLATLYRNEEYWALQQELEALSVENSSTFEVGTPAHARHQEIRAAQSRIASEISGAER